MKILVMSDMHGNTSNFERAIEREKDAKNIIFLGDGLSKAEELSYIYEDRNFYMVPGNCDGFALFEPATKIIKINGVKILITHGHAFSVKTSLNQLKERAALEGVSVALYGHTHKADITLERGTFFVNPGTLAGFNGLYSYATIEIKDKVITPKIVAL